MSFSPDNKYLAVACDRHIKVFYNITGHRVAIVDFEAKLKTSAKKTQAAKERMEQAIQEHKLVSISLVDFSHDLSIYLSIALVSI